MFACKRIAGPFSAVHPAGGMTFLYYELFKALCFNLNDFKTT